MTGPTSPAGDSREHAVPCRWHRARPTTNISGLCDDCEADRQAAADAVARDHAEQTDRRLR